ncbi:BTAD domain-containing putative transcriptional regulator [Streptomyces sp. SID486]|uniref:BTAD domain-containing putative transcriptional regulator n=1 Tax=Streptomyces sp. SID486 TaxID=2690264 RepID=UPI0031F6D743
MSDGRVVDLGGSKQRAALGFLLLQPNQAVPVSRLLTALWSTGEAPVTARKILQNAVWGLRRRLSAEGVSTGVALRTQPPGYTLEVDPEHIDLHRFRRLVAEGRALLTAGRRDEAARQLRDALRLWRGTALSDLVEVGYSWRELTMLQRSRVDVMEDYFEAELECGRHYAVLPEIESVVEGEPLRERSCGQLMRAMYRCGRQADALGVYSRLRASLVKELGLEPGRELQLLQQAILTHDPALEFTPAASPLVPYGRATPTAVSAMPAAVPATPATVPATPVAVSATPAATALGAPVGSPGGSSVAADPGDHQKPAADAGQWSARRPGPARTSTRQEASTLLLRVGVNPRTVRPDDTGAVFDRLDRGIRREIESRGGTVAAAMGTDTLGVFPARPGAPDHAERAVGAAIALRAVCAREGSAPGDVVVRAAIVTGQALMRHRTQDRPEEGVGLSLSAGGPLLYARQEMLPLVPEGAVQVCPTTREATGHRFSYDPLAGAPSRWQLLRAVPVADTSCRTRPGARGEREAELELPHSLLEHGTRRHRQHQVFLLGGSDAERARLPAEFGHIAGQSPCAAPVLPWSGSSAAAEGPYALHRAVVSVYCGTPQRPTPSAALGRLEAALHRTTADPGGSGAPPPRHLTRPTTPGAAPPPRRRALGRIRGVPVRVGVEVYSVGSAGCRSASSPTCTRSVPWGAGPVLRCTRSVPWGAGPCRC